MDWFKKWLGVKLFAACWLLVLLIPSWRQDALEQWDGETWSAVSSKRGLTGAKVAELAAKAPDDFAAQLEQVGAQYPNIVGNSKVPERARQEPFFESYRQLSHRFPRENTIRQAWLLDVTRGSLEIESASAYDDIPLQNRPTLAKNWLSDEQLEAAIGAAREGAKIEPQNSFFPWMECAISFAQKRPSEALAALERASRCTYFDDGTLQTARRRLELLGRVQNITWSHKSRAMWGLLLPHLGRIRAAARTTMEVSRQAHQGGEKARALQIAATLARAGATVSTAKSNVITVLVGDAIQSIAWQGALKNAGREVKREEETLPLASDEEYHQRNEKRRQEVVRQAALYARELKQEAIAQQVLATHQRGSILGAAITSPALNGPFQVANKMAQAFWLEARLMRLSRWGALLWLGALVLSLGRPIRLEIKRSLTIWAAFCVGATAVLLAVAVGYYNIGANEAFALQEMQNDAGQASYALDYKNNLNGYIGLLWSFPLVLTAILNGITLPRLRVEPRGFSKNRIVKMMIYSVMIGSGAIIFILGNSSFDGNSGFDFLWPASIFTFIGSILAASVFHIFTNRGKKRLAALLFSSLPWILCGAFSSQAAEFDTIWVSLILGVALIFLILGARLMGYSLFELRQWPFDFPSRLRVLSAILAVASAISYLAIKTAMIPGDAKMNFLTDTQLQHGEVGWIEAELKSSNNGA